jgi:shikimate kinase
MDFIFIHGAPGTGKSTLAWALQNQLQSPCFEFGWIPEFRVKRDSTITWEEEESLSFENLTLVVKNYVRHGFENIIITDLCDHIVQTIPEVFAGYSYRLITLWMDNDELLKSRVLEESRSSGYRNWQESLEINRTILARDLMLNEVRFNSAQLSVDQLVAYVLETL